MAGASELSGENQVIQRSTAVKHNVTQIATKSDQVADDAVHAAQTETHLSLLEALRFYKKAVLWSAAISGALIMEGFDLILLTNFFAMPSFNAKFGTPVNGVYTLSSSWQIGLSVGMFIGQIFGLFVSGIFAEMFGYRRTMLVAHTLVIAFIFISFFANNLATLLVGQILIGMPFGFFQSLATTYAGDVCPPQIRSYLTTYINLCWVFGQLIASGVLRALVDRTDVWGYKIPFAIQWVWPPILMVFVVFAPESPWWLVRKGRIEDAKKSLLRLTDTKVHVNYDVDQAVAVIIHTNALEAQTSGTSYLECLKGTNLRRTEIVCAAWASQILCGLLLAGYSSYFLENAGMSPSLSFTLTVVTYGLGGVGTFCSWFLMTWLGRRTLYLGGLGTLFIILLAIGFLYLGGQATPVQWALGVLLVIFNFVYDCTVGPVCYSIVAEIPATRLRNKSIVIARNTYNVATIVALVVAPKMLNPTAWNWGAKTGFFWAGTCFLCFVWTYFRLPEPKGRSYAELDMLFEHKISARKFKFTKMNYLGVHEYGMEKVAAEVEERVEVA